MLREPRQHRIRLSRDRSSQLCALFSPPLPRFPGCCYPPYWPWFLVSPLLPRLAMFSVCLRPHSDPLPSAGATPATIFRGARGGFQSTFPRRTDTTVLSLYRSIAANRLLVRVFPSALILHHHDHLSAVSSQRIAVPCLSCLGAPLLRRSVFGACPPALV